MTTDQRLDRIEHLTAGIAEERNKDFELVTMGYLGYRTQGYSAREVDLFVWLEVLRDKQCDDRPCEVGVLMQGKGATFAEMIRWIKAS